MMFISSALIDFIAAFQFVLFFEFWSKEMKRLRRGSWEQQGPGVWSS